MSLIVTKPAGMMARSHRYDVISREPCFIPHGGVARCLLRMLRPVARSGGTGTRRSAVKPDSHAPQMSDSQVLLLGPTTWTVSCFLAFGSCRVLTLPGTLHVTSPGR